jgi:hypothetical protein
MPLVLTRTYRPWFLFTRAFGMGANHPYDICPTGTRFPYTYEDLNLEDDRRIYFPRISKGTVMLMRCSATAKHRQSFLTRRTRGMATAGRSTSPTRRFLFPESYNARSFAQGAATDMSDSAGHHIRLNQDAVRNLEQLVSPSGHVINFKYDAANRSVEASRPRLRYRMASSNALLPGGTHRGRYRRTTAPLKISGAECDRHEKCSGDSARTADNPRELAD